MPTRCCLAPERSYLQQVEKDEHYIKTMLGLCAAAEEIVKQNNAIDIYEEYWADVDDVDAADLDTEAANMSTISQLRPPSAAGQHCAVQNVSWHPDGSHKVAHCRHHLYQCPDSEARK